MTAPEQILASAWVSRQQWPILATALFFVVVAVVVWTGDSVGPAALFAALAVATATGFISAPFIAYGAWRYRERLLPEITFVAGSAGIEYRAAAGISRMRWDEITLLRSTNRFLFLTYPPVTFVVPMRILSTTERTELRRLASDAGFGANGRRLRTHADRP
jgi:hypothetical protein